MMLTTAQHSVQPTSGTPEEAKHIHLFRRFRADFTSRFGTDCEVIGPPREIARAVLAHHPLAVALVILQIEWMTQRHYVDSTRDDHTLDPQFCSLLRHHWMEEAQHAKLDTLIVEALAAACRPEEFDRALDEYLEIGGLIDGGLGQQAAFDVDSLERATGRRLDAVTHAEIEAQQRQALRWTFLGSGITHPNLRGGHALHTKFATELLRQSDAWRLVDASEPAAAPAAARVPARSAAR